MQCWGESPGPGLRNTVLWHSCEEPFKHICFNNLADTIHASEAAIKAVMVDLICRIRASSMEEKLFIVFVLVFIFQFLLFDHVVFPKCIVLDPFNLKGGKIRPSHQSTKMQHQNLSKLINR